MSLARFMARKAIRARWRTEGRKLSTVPVAELTHAAAAYLANHPELIEEARARCAKLETDAQRAKA